MNKLAIHGGTPVINGPLPRFRTMSVAERDAVVKVIEDDCLSGFYGSWGPEFLGGPRVKEFECAWAGRFKSRYAVSVNSATSGLYAAMGAIGLEPGDEVIVPPYTMSATAMAPLVYGGLPVFADIEPETFCLDPESVRANITSRTRAILAVNLFGHPARLKDLRALADAKGLYLIEDNAQGPLAEEFGRHAGTVGHIGIFSLNYHKHIHTGEGGMCVTEDETLCQRLQMIRNHAENVVEPMHIEDPSGLVGFHYRMTELSAAVGLIQLERADELVGKRVAIAEALTRGLSGLEGITVPTVREGCRHVYYVWTFKVDPKALGCSREAFSQALSAEGFPHGAGYVRPLYLLPVFEKRRAFGDFPFNLSRRTYGQGLCPVTEKMHYEQAMSFETCAYDIDDATMAKLIEAFRKVHAGRRQL